ncbi:hypothetical protein [Nocardia fluminea]|uniref:hypothetical protein n=1 Tax=Nocardia fluminea TaxID=134984 RepID=UPI003653C8DC
MVAMANNPAASLHEVLRGVMTSGAASVKKGWIAALGATPGTPEFGRRHSEVVGLYRDLYTRLAALPEDEAAARDQYLSLMGAWYDAIVFQGNINQTPASDLGDPMVINHLIGAAQLIRSIGIATPSPSEDSMDKLRASIRDWYELLDDTELPDELRNEIRGQVQHVEWLLTNIGTYGAQPVVAAAQDLVGSGIAAMARQPKWAKRIGAALSGVVIFLGGAEQGVEHANGILVGVAEMQTHLEELVHGPKELTEAPEQRQLEAPTLGSDDDVIDAEIEESGGR